MSIVYDPRKMLEKLAPEKKVKRLLSSSAGLKKTALSFLDGAEFLDKARVSEVALKTVKSYKARIKADSEEKSDILDDPKQLIQRVQNEVVYQVSQEIREAYSGERYEWLPSDADEPDPEHQLLYGEIFSIGEGDSEGNMPGERYGCRCGMRILVPETQLEL